ncbi:MAG: pantetheine-phosphate adenylyltransferase [Candidatus Eisenbacteria bacterium]|nr:pantetheine-phosphate adenylyltransferase [Candidatus Eisenbacteria bacterium]
MERQGIFPGTFDPVTLGHLDVLTRALHLFDSIVVAVAPSDRRRKDTLFTLEERIEMIREVIPEALKPSVEVTVLEGLLVDFARRRRIQAVVRGLRFISDFEYEFQMATLNQKLSPELETVFLMPSGNLSFVNSGIVKEIARNGGNLRGLVPPLVGRRLRERYRLQAREVVGKGNGRGRGR